MTASDAVVVGRTGHVHGDIQAREIVVSGRVEGKLIAQERVELQAEALVEGDMWAQALVVGQGVLFSGNCCMGDQAREYYRASLRAMEGTDRVEVEMREAGEGAGTLTVVDPGRRVDSVRRRFR